MGELRAAAVTEVHVIVPEGIDDPARPSGGNTYDRRVCRRARRARLGGARARRARRLAAGRLSRARRPRAPPSRRIPDGAVVLLDGLIASAAPEALVPQAAPAAAGRARAHAARPPPAGRAGRRAREREVLAAAAAVVTTSAWTRRRLGELYALPADRMHVARPGVDAAALAPGTTAGDALLCVAAVTPGKGHDVLMAGLATATDLSWRCACVGSLDRTRRSPTACSRATRTNGLRDRVRFAGPRTGPELDRAYATADLLVLASHAETYGMVVTEALARGLPVLATEVGGVTEALGHGEDGTGRACWSRRATRRRSVPRCAPGSATPSCAGACAGPPGSGARRCAGGRPRRPSSPASLAGAARDRGGRPSARTGSSCASRPTRRRARPSSPSGSRGTCAADRLVIHDLGGGSGAMGRWLAPRLPGPQHWVVHDRDPDLLELAVADLPGRPRRGAPTSRDSRRTSSPARASSPPRRCSTS